MTHSAQKGKETHHERHCTLLSQKFFARRRIVRRGPVGSLYPADSGTDMEAGATEPVVLQALWVAQTALVEYFENYSARSSALKRRRDGGVHAGTRQRNSPENAVGHRGRDPADLFRVVNVAAFTQLAANDIILALDDLIDRDGYQALHRHLHPGHGGNLQLQWHPVRHSFRSPSQFPISLLQQDRLERPGIVLNDPGWSWADYVEVAKTVTDPDNDVFGSWGGPTSRDTWSVSAPWRRPAQRGRHAIPDQLGRSLGVLEPAVCADHEHKTTVQPTDIRDWKPPFAEQKIMMANDNGYRESFLREMVQDFEFDTFLIPNMGDVPRGGLVGDISAISAASGHHDLAWEWVKGTLATEEGIKRVQNARFIPLPTEAALLHEDAMVSHQYEFYVRQWINEPPRAAPTAGNGRTSDVFSTLQRGMEAAWLATEPLTDVVNSVDKEIQDILDMPPA